MVAVFFRGWGCNISFLQKDAYFKTIKLFNRKETKQKQRPIKRGRDQVW